MNWVNYADVLAQLQTFGLLVDTLEVGTRQRCRIEGDREKRGWYHLHELHTADAGTLLVGTYGVWHGNDPGTQKIALAKAQQLTPEQRLALKQRIEQDQRQARAERAREAARAASEATAMWARLAKTGESEYLKRKGVGAHGGRFAESGAFLIPMCDAAGQIHGLQAIYPAGHDKAKRMGRDKEYWPRGVSKQGHFFTLGSPQASGVCLVAEGYATGASLFEAMGSAVSVAVAFDAGNLVHAANGLRARYPKLRILICADDDYLGKCSACGQLTLVAEPACSHCAEPHGRSNAGALGASTAALAVAGEWLTPVFGAERPLSLKGPTDFNDLHALEGLQAVRAQVEAHLSALNWLAAKPAPPPATTGEGEGGADLVALAYVAQLHERFALVYEMSETVFDEQEHKLVPLGSMRNICSSRQLHRSWMESYSKRIVRVAEVGFDPTERDARVKCNLWGGWPTVARSGSCERLLELGEYLCSNEADSGLLWTWLLRWIAYPIQHPGAKLKTALVLHGPQGTGKNVFFEAVMKIYGEYGRVIDQEAVEDKFNDCLSRKLFIIADEVVARQELYTTKNKLKGLVTQQDIRINPKNVGSYFETNHLNLVFLSNETQPMVLERDDRRYCVIWTPPKLEPSFYNAVLAEIADGGIEALHDYLLHLPMGDFGPATLPPMTAAKHDLIELSLDSSERFFNEWVKTEIPLPAVAVRSEDLYDAYRHWCTRQGVGKPAQLNTFVGNTAKRSGVVKARLRHYKNFSQTHIVQSTLILPPRCGLTPAEASLTELADQINNFNTALRDWKREHLAASHIGGEKGANSADRRPSAAEEEGF